MKKHTLLLIIAVLLAFSGCSSDNKPIDTSDQNRIVVPDDPDTEKRPSSTDTTVDYSTESTSAPETSGITFPVTSDRVTTAASSNSVTAKNKEPAPSVPAEYRLEYKTSGGRYLLDADYNVSFVKDGDDPVFHKGIHTKFYDMRSSVYCKQLNKSILLDKAGNGIAVVSGMLDLPYENFMIAFKSSDSTDFKICDLKNGSNISETVYRGFNERSDGNVSLLLGSRQIDIFDGKEIVDSRKFDAVYYYVTSFALVRESGHLRLYNTNFDLLADFGEISPSNKIHFSETKFNGKDTFEFFFDSGSFKYEPAPMEDTEESQPSDMTEPAEITVSEGTTTPPDTTGVSETSAATETTAASEATETTETSVPTETTTQSVGTTKSGTDSGYVVVAQSGDIKLIESNGRYFVMSGNKLIYVEELESPLYAEIILSNVNVICVINKDLSMSAFLISDSTVEKLNIGLVETDTVGDLTIINGSIRSYVLLDGEPVLACSGGYTVIGSWLLGYDMVTHESSAYTLDCKTVVAPGDAIGLDVLPDRRLLICESNSYTIMTEDYSIDYLSSTFDRVYMTINGRILVNSNGQLLLLNMDESVEAVLGDLTGWSAITLADDESGYDESELVGTPIYYFTFLGYKNGRYSTVQYSYYPKTGAINKTEGILASAE